jgi:hypothetical protein
VEAKARTDEAMGFSAEVAAAAAVEAAAAATAAAAAAAAAAAGAGAAAAGEANTTEKAAAAGVALLEKAAWQGHAYAMLRLGNIHCGKGGATSPHQSHAESSWKQARKTEL